MLYGGAGASGVGRLARVDPATGVRVDFDINPGVPGQVPPGGCCYGGAWFNAEGELFLFYNNPGTIFQIDLGDLASPTPTVLSVQDGPSSSRNDTAACPQALIGAAKRMTPAIIDQALPQTVTIDYTIENLSVENDGLPGVILFDLSATDDLTQVFGVHGVDWEFTSISSVPVGFANPTFDGHSSAANLDLIALGQDLQPTGPDSLVTVSVELQLLTLDGPAFIKKAGLRIQHAIASAERRLTT